MKAINWTDDLTQRICDEIASGIGIREVSKENWCPSEPSIYRRMATDSEFSQRISAARAAQQDREVEECVRMADEATETDWQVVKLRIWARQWRAAKLAPRRYGDKLAIGGADDLPAIQSDVNVALDPSEAYKRMLGNG